MRPGRCVGLYLAGSSHQRTAGFLSTALPSTETDAGWWPAPRLCNFVFGQDIRRPRAEAVSWKLRGLETASDMVLTRKAVVIVLEILSQCYSTGAHILHALCGYLTIESFNIFALSNLLLFILVSLYQCKISKFTISCIIAADQLYLCTYASKSPI